MNPAIATVVVAVVAVIGAIIGSVISSWLNRDKDDADIAEKVSKAWDPVFARMDKDIQRLDAKCSKCESELDQWKRIIRAAVRAHDVGDTSALVAALSTARDMLDQ